MTRKRADSEQVRVVIVDDHDFVRSAMGLALEPEESIEVVGEARSGAEAISVVRATQPDVVVLDYRLGDADAPEIIRSIRELGCTAEIVVMTSYGSRHNVHAAIDQGARAFLTKQSTDIARLATAVLDAHERKNTLSEDALDELLQIVRGGDNVLVMQATPRAREVWRLVALGNSNADIAATLFLSERTVKYHVGNLLAATSARSRAELVAIAYRVGLMDEPE